MIGWRAKALPAETEKPKGFDDFDLRLGDLMRGERATLGKSLLDIQRDLKIKATYIAAIENADVSAFETPGFIAGYVRSYARYLGMDPDWAFTKFCREANFEVAHGMSAAASSVSLSAARARQLKFEKRDPLGNSNTLFSPQSQGMMQRLEPGALGSFAVLVALIVALGYGGWSLLQEVQRVQLSPVETAPEVVAQLDPLADLAPVDPLLSGTIAGTQMGVGQTTLGGTDTADASAVYDPLQRATQPQALDLPVLNSRDGPISGIDPKNPLALAQATPDVTAQQEIDAAVVQVVADINPNVELLAVKPAWVQVSSADGTVLFEKILDAGERYVVPSLEVAAVLRAGNSGSLYFVMGGEMFGPAANGANVVKNLSLAQDSLKATYAVANLENNADLAQYMTAQITIPQTPSDATSAVSE